MYWTPTASNCSAPRLGRDPPGRQSNYDYRNGGEVYIRDLESKQTTRVTFDSPKRPRGKWAPPVGFAGIPRLTSAICSRFTATISMATG